MELDAYHALAGALLAQRTKEAATDLFLEAIKDRSQTMLAPIQVPSIGRTVLYHHDSGVLLPGIVVSVLDHETFEAQVVAFGVPVAMGLTRDAHYFNAPYDATGTKPGCWSWPPRV